MRQQNAGFVVGLLGSLLFFSSCFLYLDISGHLSAKRKPDTINFPVDHAHHPGSVTEWWYFNGHLVSATGDNYAYGFCLFRVSGFIYFAHISFTDEKNGQFHFDRVFYPPSTARFRQNNPRVSYKEEQVIEQVSPGEFRIKGRCRDIVLDLVLRLEKKPMLVNGNGSIDMPEGGNSGYYSLTRLKTSGFVRNGKDSMVVSGLSWMDHQWGDFYVNEKGWDWFALQLADSTDYNIYSFRNSSGRILKQYVNISDREGHTSTYGEVKIIRSSFWRNRITGNRYITGWELILPGRKDTLLLGANMNDQEIYSSNKGDRFPDYWEGSCRVIKKTAEGRVVKGIGFSEHFPY